MAISDNRQKPNVLVTGTPGTGKSTLCQLLVQYIDLQHLNVSEIVKEGELYQGWDEEFDCSIFDEDKVCDALEDKLEQGGYVVDFHTCDFFPERWFDLVIVLITDNTVLYDRLEARLYSQKKIQENVECEIMQVIVSEAQDSYPEEIVQVLKNDTPQEMESNVHRIIEWNQQWRIQRQM
eukprot:TRINITY_DN5695_c0_g2_i1.p3 TRINITY_DN5695_c0_g2~~TRINITY_DN5695_c0_g2_i1.p3  ORF type:complete len:206 (-),score=12.98 TRINITY_DN5695_c0_g2_i1:228-764(-)